LSESFNKGARRVKTFGAAICGVSPSAYIGLVHMTAMTIPAQENAVPAPDEPGEYPTPLAELIETVRAEKRLSLAAVAKRAGWNSSTAVLYYTKGRWPKRPVPQAVQQQIADGLGIPLYRVQEAVKASIGEIDEIGDIAALSTEQKIVLAAMRKADEETQRYVAELTLNATEFAERHVAAMGRATLLSESDNDTKS
jgi:transcriptional regulator with XRE-family HTH domain